MATKKYLSLDRLTEYDGLIKGEISTGDASTLSSAKSYTDTEVAKKADKTHSHNDLYYTETEIDSKLSEINTSITNITSGTTPVKEAQHATSADAATNAGHATSADSATSANHATSADSATNATNATKADTASNAEKLGGQLPSYYAKASDIPTGALANKDIVSETDLDSALAAKVNAAADGNHSHSNMDVIEGITADKVSAWDISEANAKAYTNEKIALLMNNSSEAVDSIMELAEAMEENADVVSALNQAIGTKANASDLTTHTGNTSNPHGVTKAQVGLGNVEDKSSATIRSEITKSNVTTALGYTPYTPTEVDTKLSGKADSSHGNHVPTTQTANNAVFLRNDNAWATVTPENIGAAATSHNHTVANITDLTATATELNYMDGVTSNVQTQLDGKSPSGHGHDVATTTAAGFMSAAMVTKLNGIAEGANNTIVDTALSDSSTNPVQNKVVNSAIVTATSAITLNANSISTHTGQISDLQAAIAEIQEITSEDIQALFA